LKHQVFLYKGRTQKIKILHIHEKSTPYEKTKK